MSDGSNITDNVTLFKENTSTAIDVINDGTYERLACDVYGSVSIDYDESPTRYQLKSNYNASGTSVASSPDTTLYTYTGQGVIDLVAVNCLTSANWGVDIIIDGTSRLRISMPDLGSSLGLTSVGFDVVVETANKQFRWHPQQIGFTSSFAINAYATGTTVTLNHLVLFRERV